MRKRIKNRYTIDISNTKSYYKNEHGKEGYIRQMKTVLQTILLVIVWMYFGICL